MKSKRLLHKTVVITGASSGIGRAAAHAFAREGANLGLIARNEEGLRSLVSELRTLGAEAIPLTCDVTHARAVRQAAHQVAKRFGGIDVWINNAGVSLYGEADKVPVDEMKRVMDVNFFGQVNGVQAALPYLEDSAGGGRLLGTLSVLSEAATPLQSAYVASKHALFGFYKSLREELMHRRSRVRLTTLFVSSVSTPLFDHAKTYLGYRPKPISPVYPASRVADAMVEEAIRPHFTRVVGGFALISHLVFHFFPELGYWLESRTAYRSQRSREPKGVTDGDNLFMPMPGLNTVNGSATPSKAMNFIETRLSRVLLYGGLMATFAALLSGRAEKPRRAA